MHILIDNHADLSVTNKCNSTPLHVAVARGNLKFLNFQSRNSRVLVKKPKKKLFKDFLKNLLEESNVILFIFKLAKKPRHINFTLEYIVQDNWRLLLF